jgi:hypothetical protein
MYAGYPREGHECMCAGPMQAAYTSITPQKMKTDNPTHAGSTGIED